MFRAAVGQRFRSAGAGIDPAVCDPVDVPGAAVDKPPGYPAQPAPLDGFLYIGGAVHTCMIGWDDGTVNHCAYIYINGNKRVKDVTKRAPERCQMFILD